MFIFVIFFVLLIPVVTVDDNLWALSLQDELLQHMSHTPLGTSGFQNEKHLCHSTDDDWEMIEGCS